MNSHQIAVVGGGYWGPNLIRNIRSLPNASVSYVCDVKPERLAHLSALYPELTTTTSFEDVLSDPETDAVAIATPVSTHFELAKRSLLAGKHTFIEKPMAASTRECRELVDIADSSGITLMVGHTFLYTSAVRMIKELIDEDEIGDILYISTRRLNLGLFQADINAAWDLAPHDISIVLYLLGRSPISVNCQGKAHLNPRIEDVTSMSLTFDNGGFAIIQSSWIDPKKIREVVVVGSKKMVVYDDTEPLEKLRIYDKRVEAPPHYDTYAEFHFSYHYGDMKAPFLKQTEPLREECAHFVECIEGTAACRSDGRQGMQVVEILEAANSSLRSSGAAVKLQAAAT